jgi:hypothetical protein
MTLFEILSQNLRGRIGGNRETVREASECLGRDWNRALVNISQMLHRFSQLPQKVHN